MAPCFSTVLHQIQRSHFLFVVSCLHSLVPLLHQLSPDICPQDFYFSPRNKVRHPPHIDRPMGTFVYKHWQWQYTCASLLHVLPTEMPHFSRGIHCALLLVETNFLFHNFDMLAKSNVRMTWSTYSNSIWISPSLRQNSAGTTTPIFQCCQTQNPWEF